MGWITTKFLAYVAGALLLLNLLQLWNASALRDSRDEAIREGAVALSANRTSTAMITALVAQRDGLLLARAADEKAISEAMQQAAAYVKQQNDKLRQAVETIRELAARPDCYNTMQQAVCPSIANELRAP